MSFVDLLLDNKIFVGLIIVYVLYKWFNRPPSGPQSFSSLFTSEKRKFLISNKGAKVDVDSLEGKIVGIYFSAHWCPPCKAYTPQLAKVLSACHIWNEFFNLFFYTFL